jgi:hypothetical protein
MQQGRNKNSGILSLPQGSSAMFGNEEAAQLLSNPSKVPPRTPASIPGKNSPSLSLSIQSAEEGCKSQAVPCKVNSQPQKASH